MTKFLFSIFFVSFFALPEVQAMDYRHVNFFTGIKAADMWNGWGLMTEREFNSINTPGLRGYNSQAYQSYEHYKNSYLKGLKKAYPWFQKSTTQQQEWFIRHQRRIIAYEQNQAFLKSLAGLQLNMIDVWGPWLVGMWCNIKNDEYNWLKEKGHWGDLPELEKLQENCCLKN